MINALYAAVLQLILQPRYTLWFSGGTVIESHEKGIEVTGLNGATCTYPSATLILFFDRPLAIKTWGVTLSLPVTFTEFLAGTFENSAGTVILQQKMLQ